MDLRTWILSDLDDAHERFATSIAAHVPPERWRERPGDAGSSIAALRFHAARHADLAVSTAVRGEAPVATAWWKRLGLDGAPAAAGLAEAEDTELTSALDLDALGGYAVAVHDAIAGWLTFVDLEELDGVPSVGPHLEEAGIATDDLPWLHRQWGARPVSWFVRWPAIGHVHGHVAEMTAVRARLGLSPF